jgi:hypothetical protein
VAVILAVLNPFLWNDLSWMIASGAAAVWAGWWTMEKLS